MKKLPNTIAGVCLLLTAGFVGHNQIMEILFPEKRKQSSAIVLDLEAQGLVLVGLKDGVHFDIDSDEFAEKTAWIGGGGAFLAQDMNHNGVIDGQAELLGDDKKSFAPDKLSLLDKNHDGYIEAEEMTASALQLWQDKNQDGISQSKELFTPGQKGIEKIESRMHSLQQMAPEHQLVQKAAWYKPDGTAGGYLYDVVFATRNEDSWYIGSDTTRSPALDTSTLMLPHSRGYGLIKPLHLAASESPVVKNALTAFCDVPLDRMTDANAMLADLLFKWAAVEGTSMVSDPKFYHPKVIAFMEKLTDHSYNIPRKFIFSPNAKYTDRLSDSWGMAWQALKPRLMAQGPLKNIFSGAYYSFATDQLIIGDSLSEILARAIDMKPETGRGEYWQEIGQVLFASANQLGGSEAVLEAFNRAVGEKISLQPVWLPGQVGDNRFKASRFGDLVETYDGADVILGLGGNDRILSGGGDDMLNGGRDADILTGGTGSDCFTFDSIDSNSNGDTITDFSHEEKDKIKLRKFGLKPTDFAGESPIGEAGKFGYTPGTDSHGRVVQIIWIDTDQNGQTEQTITLENAAKPIIDDFILR